MTEISDAGRKLAAELANAERKAMGHDPNWEAKDFATHPMGSVERALARLATDHLALKAEHEKTVADLREIDRLAGQEPLNWIREGKHNRTYLVAAIAAKYRETDPLGEALANLAVDPVPFAEALRAELSKRGFEIARVKP